jgi:hypothetical protein
MLYCHILCSGVRGNVLFRLPFKFMYTQKKNSIWTKNDSNEIDGIFAGNKTNCVACLTNVLNFLVL